MKGCRVPRTGRLFEGPFRHYLCWFRVVTLISILRISVPDGKTGRVLDLKDVTLGSFWDWVSLLPDDSALLMLDKSTREITGSTSSTADLDLLSLDHAQLQLWCTCASYGQGLGRREREAGVERSEPRSRIIDCCGTEEVAWSIWRRVII